MYKQAIDVHTHYFPKDALTQLGSKHSDLELVVEEKGSHTEIHVGHNIHDLPNDSASYYLGRIEMTLKEMDRQKIDRRIFSIVPPLLGEFYTLDENLSMQACRTCNDFAAEAMKKHSDRLTYMATIPLQSPMAPDELKRAIEDLGLGGVEIGSNVLGKNLDEEEFRPVFQTANKLNVPIFVHPVRVAAKDRLKKYHLSNVLGNPLDTSIAAASLICGGVLEEFPNLKVILAHAGGYLPYQIGRLDHAYKVRPDGMPAIKKAPSSYFDRIYFDTITHSPIVLKFLIQMVGPAHVVLGSDFPADMGYSDPRGYVEALDLPDEATQKILGENAAELFR